MKLEWELVKTSGQYRHRTFYLVMTPYYSSVVYDVLVIPQYPAVAGHYHFPFRMCLTSQQHTNGWLTNGEGVDSKGIHVGMFAGSLRLAVAMSRGLDLVGAARVQGKEGGPRSARKVTIVGAGSVGVAIGISLLAKKIADKLVLVDVFKDKAVGEAFDMQHGLAFLEAQEVIGGDDYSLTEGSKVCIITAGARQKPGQSRTDMLEANIKILRPIVTELVQYSPDAIFILVSNPVDVLTYAAWRISGLPLNRIFGSGTHLDSARFQYYIGKFTGLPIHLIKAQILGEHGKSCVPLWSGVRIAGNSIEQLEDVFTEENKNAIFEQVLESVPELLKLKGYTSTAVGLAVADQVESILFNKMKATAVSTLVKGFCGIDEEVFLSIPCLLGSNGISTVLTPKMNEDEKNKYKSSAENMFKYQQDIEDIISNSYN